jgi:hypothetical protein
MATIKKAQMGKKVAPAPKQTAAQESATISKMSKAMSKGPTKEMGMNFSAKDTVGMKEYKPKMKSGGKVGVKKAAMQLGSYKNVIGKNTKGKATKAVGLIKAKKK